MLAPNPSPDICQFASISSDGQILLWDRRFQDSQKKAVTDVSLYQFRWRILYGKQDMDSKYFDLKEEVF